MLSTEPADDDDDDDDDDESSPYPGCHLSSGKCTKLVNAVSKENPSKGF